MTEQISHKKSLRIERLHADRRKLLEEYSQLEGAQTTVDEAGSVPTASQNEEQTSTETNPQQEREQQQQQQQLLSLEERPISELSIKEVVQVHNKLVGKEIEMNNSIKGTIYDNYYDLIRVNDLLKKLIVDTEGGEAESLPNREDQGRQDVMQQQQEEEQEKGGLSSRRGKIDLAETDNVHLLMQKLSSLREDLGLPH